MSKFFTVFYFRRAFFDALTGRRTSRILCFHLFIVALMHSMSGQSLLRQVHEKNGLKETANRLGKGIIAFSPLAQGLLTDRYLHGIPEDSRIRTDGRFLKESTLTEEKLEQIRALNAIAAARGQTLAEMALAWILKDGQVTSVLIGASRPEQILDDLKALDNTAFTPDELRAIDAASGF